MKTYFVTVTFFFFFMFYSVWLWPHVATNSFNNEAPAHVPDDTARRHFTDSHNGRYQPVVIFEGFQVHDHKAE